MGRKTWRNGVSMIRILGDDMKPTHSYPLVDGKLADKSFLKEEFDADSSLHCETKKKFDHVLKSTVALVAQEKVEPSPVETQLPDIMEVSGQFDAFSYHPMWVNDVTMDIGWPSINTTIDDFDLPCSPPGSALFEVYADITM